jgi:hypothetical protein
LRKERFNFFEGLKHSQKPRCEMRKKIVITAITDRDLQAVLEEHGLAGMIDAKELTCCACSDVLTWENIGAFVVSGEGVKLFCSLSECIESAERAQKL